MIEKFARICSVSEFLDRKHQWLHWMLVHPFLRQKGTPEFTGVERFPGDQRASVSLIDSATCRNAPSNAAASASGTMVK